MLYYLQVPKECTFKPFKLYRATSSVNPAAWKKNTLRPSESQELGLEERQHIYPLYDIFSLAKLSIRTGSKKKPQFIYLSIFAWLWWTDLSLGCFSWGLQTSGFCLWTWRPRNHQSLVLDQSGQHWRGRKGKSIQWHQINATSMCRCRAGPYLPWWGSLQHPWPCCPGCSPCCPLWPRGEGRWAAPLCCRWSGSRSMKLEPCTTTGRDTGITEWINKQESNTAGHPLGLLKLGLDLVWPVVAGSSP